LGVQDDLALVLAVQGFLRVTAYGLPNPLPVAEVPQVIDCLRAVNRLAGHHGVQGFQLLIGAVDRLAVRTAAVRKFYSDVQMGFHVFAPNGYYCFGGKNVGYFFRV